jgi:hypothetical protein
VEIFLPTTFRTPSDLANARSELTAGKNLGNKFTAFSDAVIKSVELYPGFICFVLQTAGNEKDRVVSLFMIGVLAWIKSLG